MERRVGVNQGVPFEVNPLLIQDSYVGTEEVMRQSTRTKMNQYHEARVLAS